MATDAETLNGHTTAVGEMVLPSPVEGAVQNGVRKRGAPPGNLNSWKHGMRSTRGLTLGEVPKKAQHIKRTLSTLRRALVEEVITVKGRLSLLDEAFIVSALKWSRHGDLCMLWLRQEYQSLTVDQKANLSREVARAGSERDKCLEKLGLDKREDVWDSLTVDPIQTPIPAANATDATVGDSERSA